MRKNQKVTCVRVNMSLCVFTCLKSLRHEVRSHNLETFKPHFLQCARPNTRKPLFGVRFEKTMTQRATSTNQKPEVRPISEWAALIWCCPRPLPLHAGPTGAAEPRTPGEGALRRDRGAIKSRGGRGMRFLAAQSPCSPGSSSLPRSVPPSCLLIISFYSFLKRWRVFFIPLFISSQSAAARTPSDPRLSALRSPGVRRSGSRLILLHPSVSLSLWAPLRCSPRSASLSPPSFNFTETPV